MSAKKLEAIQSAMLETIAKADELAAQIRPHRRTTAGTARAYTAYTKARQELDTARNQDPDHAR
jgi:hypothetical protein